MVGECTCSALRMAARRLTQAYDAALVSQGVNTSQYALLSRLGGWPDEAPTVRQLAESLGLDRTTLAHNLRPLERDGLVAVTPDPQDRRAHRIRLTSAGRTKRDACLPLWRKVQENFDRSFGADRASDLMNALAAIAQTTSLTERVGPQEKSHAG